MKQYLLQSWIAPYLYVDASSIADRGVFTSEPIAIGEVVIIWGGTVFSKDEMQSGKAKRHTAVGIDEELYLASRADEERGIDDYMNHSCNPNMGMKDEVTLVALRDIQSGEELTADYAMWLNDENYVMQQECKCGYMFCRKIVTGRDWMRRDIQERYRGFFSPFIARRIEKLRSGT